jgi:hypothetical protein
MSTIKTNTLTGTTSAGVINVTAEGGVETTNLQKGLAKVFINLSIMLLEIIVLTLIIIWQIMMFVFQVMHQVQTL